MGGNYFCHKLIFIDGCSLVHQFPWTFERKLNNSHPKSMVIFCNFLTWATLPILLSVQTNHQHYLQSPPICFCRITFWLVQWSNEEIHCFMPHKHVGCWPEYATKSVTNSGIAWMCKPDKIRVQELVEIHLYGLL